MFASSSNPEGTLAAPSPNSSGAAVFRRHLTAPLWPEAVSADGVYVIDRAGRRYLDGSSGTGISCLGHSNVYVKDAMHRQIDRIAFAHTAFFTNEPMEKLADSLTANLPGSSVWFTTSGAEGVDASLKLTLQYFSEIGQSERKWIIGRQGGYLGASIGALSVGGHAGRRGLFEPLLSPNVVHIPPCFPFRLRNPTETDEAYGIRAANELEQAIDAVGGAQVGAFIAETVVGSTSGAVAAPPGYFRRIREICDRHGILLILDEVMCGMGRTGTRYAFEQEGILPDMVILGKGLAAGYAPLGAVIVSKKVRELVRAGSGSFQHGHSAHGHMLACATALAVQEEIERRGLLGEVERKGARLRSLLEERFRDHPHVGDIRGRGLFLALELVKDRSTLQPFAPDVLLHTKIKSNALAAGLMCYPSSGTIDGVRGDHVMIMPPFIVEECHLDELIEKLSQALELSFRDAAEPGIPR
jgi:adenosylmethionine-8-amino-7-oxononanoate aminotransferase